MAVITEDIVRALASFKGDGAPVTSCYLDVDGRYLPTHKDLQRAFAALVRRARLRADGRAHASVLADVGRMERYVRGYRRRSEARGLAMFSCAEQDLWEVHELPTRVTSQLVVNTSPCVRQLEEVVTRTVRYGVLLTDRQRARMFRYELADMTPAGEVLDGIVRQGEDARGEMVKTRVASQFHEQARQHLKRAAGLAFDAFQRSPFDHLLVATPTPEVRSELEPLLHPYLRDRLAEQLAVAVNAPDDQIRAAVADAESRVEQRTEAALVARLRDAVGARAGGVDGLKATLAALCKHRVDRLLVSRGFSAEGWRCNDCGCLATIGRRCPSCGAQMVHAPDVVEDAVEQALAQGCRVDVLVANADLDVLGGIGAFLRY